MGRWSPVLAATAPRRRVGMIIAAATVLPFVVADAILLPDRRIAEIAAAWMLALLGGGLLQHRRRPRACAAGVFAATLATTVGAVAVILMTGGSKGPLFGLLMALPPCIALFYPEFPGMTLGTAALSIGAGVTACVQDGQSARYLGYWIGVASVVAGLAVSAAKLIRRQAAHELTLEKLAEAGRLAAAVAHDVNSPLSAARSNLLCLLGDPNLPKEDHQAALQETFEAVQRIIDTIDRLRPVMWQAGSPKGADCHSETTLDW